MAWLVDLIREFGFGIVFLNVLIEQLGAPIPAYPVLVITGALEGAMLVARAHGGAARFRTSARLLITSVCGTPPGD